MLKIKDFIPEEIDYLKKHFTTFLKEFELDISKSNIFSSFTEEHTEFKRYDGSFTSEPNTTKRVNSGVTIFYNYDNPNSFYIILTNKEKKHPYNSFMYFPFYLYDGKSFYEHQYINGDYEKFLKLFESKSFILNQDELKFLEYFHTKFFKFLQQIRNDCSKIKNEFPILKNLIIKELDINNDGEVDIVDVDSFNKLLTKNQKSVIDIDKNYIQKFVKISMYLKTKKSNTQKIFETINETKNKEELDEIVNLLKNQIHTYDLLVFHSINMITSLVDSDLITFYEIYECFDELGVFNSNWENEVSNQLLDIGDGIKDLMYSIYQMENKIVNSIDNLTYVTQDSFKKLNLSVNNQLSSINSSIKFNSLLTGIQSYQMYKINQNTKTIG
jgi:hypothetical protein